MANLMQRGKAGRCETVSSAPLFFGGALWGDGKSVFFHHGSEFVAKPIDGETELPEGVVVGALVFEGLAGGLGDLARGGVTEVDVKMTINGSNRIARVGNKITIADA